MSKISDKILDIIKGEHLKPKPKWQFLLKSYLIWAVAIISALVGALAFSVMLFELVNADWELLEYLPRTPLQHLLATLPYLWIILMALFVWLAYYNGRHTRDAYKYQAYWFVVGSLVVSVVLGGVIYAFGLAPRIHYFLNQRLPIYGRLVPDRMELLVQPENGLLAGEITKELTLPALFELEDFSGQDWLVEPASNYQTTLFEVEEGGLVRIIGQLESAEEHIFDATRVLPFHVGPGMIRGRLRVLPFQPGPLPPPGGFRLFER